MKILYVISVIILLTLFMMVKKSEKKLNGLGIFGLGIVLLLCYNVFECYILNFFKINLSLLNLGIVNLIVDIVFGIYILKKKEMQKYFVETRDLIFSMLIGLIVLVIGIIQYSNQLSIKYETTDSAVHYRATQLFVENESLLNNVKDEIYNFRSFKIGAYVNSGLLMKICSSFFNEEEYYKLFIVFDLIIIFLIGYMLYFACVKISKGKLSVIAFLVAIFGIIGYPLNGLEFGFEYLMIALLMIITIIYLASFYKEEEINFKQIIMIFFLLNFELFCTYYLFIPFMYSALFIFLCIQNYKRDKKFWTKRNISILIVSLIIPFILGFIYHLKPDLYSTNLVDYGEGVITSPVASVGGLVSDGYIYKDLYTNIILLLPLTFFVIFKERKEFNFSSIVYVFLAGFLILLFAGLLFHKVSEYYIGKNYYALWIVLWYFNFKGLYYLYLKKSCIPCVLITAYIVIIMISFNLSYSVKVENKFSDLKLNTVSEIYSVNYYLMVNSKTDLNTHEMDLINYANENLDKNKKIEIMGTEEQILWSYPLLNYVSYYEKMDKLGHQDKLRYKYMNYKVIENSDYIICFNKSNFYKKYDSNKLKNLEILYENEFGKVLKNM